MKKLVIIPTYNEIKNIGPMLETVLGLGIDDLDVLVVDDSSPDGTGQFVANLAKQNPKLKLLQREGKLGLGTAYVAGFKIALEKDYDLIIEMDADFSHDPHVLPKLIKAAEEYDIAIGSRYVSGVNVVNWPLRRLLLSMGASLYTRIITGLPIQDCTAGFKCFHRKVLESIDLDSVQSDGYAFQIEMNFKAWKKGFTLGEVPIVFVDRTEGESKMSKRIIREAMWVVWKLKFQSLFGKLA